MICILCLGLSNHAQKVSKSSLVFFLKFSKNEIKKINISKDFQNVFLDSNI